MIGIPPLLRTTFTVLSLHVHAIVTQAACGPGNYLSNGIWAGSASCQACPVGWYSNRNNAPQCYGCPPGTYSYLSRRSVCHNCPAGRFKSTTTYVRTYTGSCGYCPTGYESPSAGAALCNECSEGTYNDQNGQHQSSCKNCELGLYNQDVGSKSRYACKECGKGKYTDNIATVNCKSCEPGTFNTYLGSEDAEDCILCSKGTSSIVDGATDITDCVVCPPGTYQNALGQSQCKDCGTGKYSTAHGSQSEAVCTSCPKGKYQSVLRSTNCTACSIGMYAGQVAMANCLGCPKGLFANESQSVSCFECPRGRNLVDTSGTPALHASIDSCSLCPTGTYNPIEGLGTTCFSCPASLSEGVTTCSGCDPGKYKLQGTGGCVACAPGKHTDAMDLPICRSCPSGWYGSVQPPYVRCLACDRGKYGRVVAAPDANAGCLTCDVGRYSAAEALEAEIGKIPCLACPSGRWSSALGVDKEARCKYCSPGRWSAIEASSNETACNRCSPGTYSEKVGAELSSACSLCPVGFFQKSAGSAYCMACKVGQFSINPGKPQCQECERGKFKSSLGDKSLVCSLCPAGFSQNFTSQGRCLPCLPGRTVGVAGSAFCVACTSGRYVGQEASDKLDCTVAPTGRYVGQGSTATIIVPEGFRALSCVAENGEGCQGSKVCEEGTYGTEPPTGDCFDCPAGYYSSVGWVRCRMCSPGKFSDHIRHEECKDCPVGYANTADGLTLCTECPLGKSTAENGLTSCEILSDDTVAPPTLLSLYPADKHSSGLILHVAGSMNNVPLLAESLLVQWSTSKKFRNSTGDMRQLIVPIQDMNGSATNTVVSFNASRPGSVWRSPLYLRSCFMLSSGRNGRFSEINGWSRVASDCRDKGGSQQYLQTHENDDTFGPPFDLLLKGRDGFPNCRPCPNGGSCNSPGSYEHPGAPGILVWNIAPKHGFWRVPWNPSNNTPLFYRCPRPLACLGVRPEDTFNATSGWPIINATCSNGTHGPLCSVCMQGYNRVQGSCEKCIPVANRIGFVIGALMFLAVAIVLAVRAFRKTRSEVRFALRDINRIVLICLSLSQINVTVPEVIVIEWPQNVLKFLDSFGWSNIDLADITGATCEASVDFRFTFLCMACVPILVMMLAFGAYFRGRRNIITRINKLRLNTQEEQRHEMMTCYVEIFRIVDSDKSGEISAEEFIDLLKLVGYDNDHGTLTVPVALRAVQRITGSSFATTLSLRKFVDGMEQGTIVEVADALVGKKNRRRSSGSRALDKLNRKGKKKTTKSGLNKSNSTVFGGNIKNIIHDADTFSLVIWNSHRKLVASSFSWAMQLMMLMHTPISRKVFQYMDCVDVGTGEYVKSFVRADYSIACTKLGGKFDEEYITFLPLVILVLCGFTLLLPFGILAYLFFERKNLYSPSVNARIGWLYDRMNRGTEFWEIHEMLRKMLLTGVVVFFPRDPAVKSMIALAICIAAQVSLSLFRPHKSKLVFVTAQFAYAMALCMYLMASMLAFAKFDVEERELVGIFIVVMQSLFVVFGLTAIAVSLLTIRSRFQHDKRASLSIEAHVKLAERRRSSVQKEKRDSANNLLTRLKGIVGDAVVNQEALAVMRRHSKSLQQRIKTINILRVHSQDKLKRKLFQRSRSKRIKVAPVVDVGSGNAPAPGNDGVMQGGGRIQGMFQPEEETQLQILQNAALQQEQREEKEKRKSMKLYDDVRSRMRRVTSVKKEVKKYDAEIDQIRKVLRNKCGNGKERRLENVFKKADIDHSGTLSEEEFKRFVRIVFKKKDEVLLNAVWFSIVLCSGGKDTVDSVTLSKWVFSPTVNGRIHFG